MAEQRRASGKVGAHGRRIMEALEAGRVFRRTAGGWQGGTIEAPASVVADLVRRDLVREAGERLELTAAGRGWSVRAARPEAANRLLAERAVPTDVPGTAEARRPVRARSVTVNLAESPLGWLKARGLVDARQYEAGERLRGDWTIAGLGPRVTMRWDAGPRSSGARGPGGAIDPTLAQIAAKRRMEAALAAAGPGLADILWRVACAGEGIEAAEGALGWPKRAGKLVLTLALDRIAVFYGMEQNVNKPLTAPR